MDERKPEINSSDDWREGKTPEEIAEIEAIGAKVTKYYNQPEDQMPPPDGNEHKEGLSVKRALEQKNKKD